MPSEAREASEGWSGRRGSNPRPTAWKAVTLPLSYSRLRHRLLRFLGLRRGKPAFVLAYFASSDFGEASPPSPLSSYSKLCYSFGGLPTVAGSPFITVHLRSRQLLASYGGQPSRLYPAKVGGEARIRTLVATGATDLQSVAIDRSATSPIVCLDSLAVPAA